MTRSAADPAVRRFSPGDVVVRREILLGEVWIAFPTICVEDSAELLALYLPAGTRFGFPDTGAFPAGRHPWQSRRECWSGHGKLMLHRPGEAHSVDVFWTGPQRRLAGWYFNLQDPFRRTRIGIDTLDHELDLWWAADAPGYVWKDVELFEQRLTEGRYPGRGEEIRAEGRRIAALLDAGHRWWDERWADWTPESAWPVPELPADWLTEPATVA
ncbi:MAG TPA: DUF402 domain-containing protein [Micromonospora sp.]